MPLERPGMASVLWLFTVLTTGAVVCPVRAQGPASPAPPAEAALGLGDLLRLSLEQNPILKQAGFDVQAAQGRAVQAGLYPNPTVSVTGDEMGDRTGPGGIWTAPLVTQEIVTGGKRQLSRAVAQKEVDQATLALMRQRYALFTTVRQGYFEVLAAQRRVEILTSLVEVAQKSYETAESLLKGKQIAPLDLLPFRVELNRLRVDLEAARRELTAAWRRLAANMGAPNLPPTSLLGSLEALMPDYDFDRARAYMLEVHPEVRSAQVGVGRAELALRRAQVERIPNVTVGAGYVRQNQNRSDDWLVQVSVPVPVFNRNQGNILAAQAEVGRAMQEINRAQNDLINRLATAFGQYAAARQRAEVYRTAILPDARESYRLSLAAFKGGQFEFLRVLQAQRQAQEANLEYVRALADVWRAASEIAGLVLEEHWPTPSDGPCAPANG
ncbi:MAG: TolC family protein [Gemmataceae bacterium]|nr:TolC family protein [Gemmataceae bacterium]